MKHYYLLVDYCYFLLFHLYFLLNLTVYYYYCYYYLQLEYSDQFFSINQIENHEVRSVFQSTFIDLLYKQVDVVFLLNVNPLRLSH